VKQQHPFIETRIGGREASGAGRLELDSFPITPDLGAISIYVALRLERPSEAVYMEPIFIQCADASLVSATGCVGLLARLSIPTLTANPELEQENTE
jgi:hypothetical protein